MFIKAALLVEIVCYGRSFLGALFSSKKNDARTLSRVRSMKRKARRT